MKEQTSVTNTIVIENLEDFLNHFFSDSSFEQSGKTTYLNPSPCCGHNDCLTVHEGSGMLYCFSCTTSINPIQLIKNKMGKDTAQKEFENWVNKFKESVAE